MQQTIALSFLAFMLSSAPGRLLADDEASDIAPPTGTWLMDYGLATGLSIENPTVTDAEYVLVWMNAATEVSPSLAEAYLWQYDLRARLGRPEEALKALRAYSAEEPNDLSALLNLIDAEFHQAQTAEDRIQVCNKYLQSQGDQRAVASDMHRRLADLYLGRGDQAEARRHATAALQRLPQNIPARALLAQIEGRLEDPATQVELMLLQIGVDPWSAELRWSLALFLDRLSLHEQAQWWYEAAGSVIEYANPQSAPPLPLLLDKARSHFDAESYEEAIAICRKILAREPTVHQATMLLIRAARALGRQDVAEEHVTALAAMFREIESDAVAKRDAALFHDIATFHMDVQPDSGRALQFALLAVRDRPNEPVFQKTLGEAYVEHGQPAEAVEILKPLADTDQEAALQLARAYRSLGDEDAARRVLRGAEKMQYSGATYRRVAALLAELGESAAPKPGRDEVRSKLSAFDKRVLAFPSEAGQMLDFRVELEHEAVAFGQPIHARFILANKGEYPVTLGDDRMVSPTASVSVHDMWRRGGAALDAYLAVSLDRRVVLLPGERIEVRKRLSDSTAQLLMRRHPQRAMPLEFTCVLDPVQSEQGLKSVLPGVSPVVQEAVRAPVDASARGIDLLRTQLNAGSEAQRINTIDILLALVLEKEQSLHDRTLHYAASAVNVEKLTQMILEALKDPSAVVRAHALWALIYRPLPADMVNKVAPSISDPSWLVRLLAVELFAKQQGPVFLPVLERLAEDENSLVAKLASLYRDQARQMRHAAPSAPRGVPDGATGSP